MHVFKDKGEGFNIALAKVDRDIQAARKRSGKLDTDLFIANTMLNSSYKYFYNNYCGRGIQYSTFVSYAAAAFFIEEGMDSENGMILSRIVKERQVEKLDRLKGRKGCTTLVKLCQEYDDPRQMYAEINKNWKHYQKRLKDEGCWLGKPRSEAFSLKEITGMYELVNRFPEIFRKDK